MAGYDKLTELIFTDKYRYAKNRLVLLDYDGTLVNYEHDPENARPSGHLLEVLTRLSAGTNTMLFIITGRGYRDIDRMIGHSGLDIIAEHGAMIRYKGEWKKQFKQDNSWKRYVAPVLYSTSAGCPGSFVEEKEYSFAWHYRNSDNEKGYVHSRKLIRTLTTSFHLYNLKVLDGNKVVEIMSRDISKGNAVKYLLSGNIFDCIVCIGDDRTDEEMFYFLRDNNAAVTVKVGEGETFARYKIGNVGNVLKFLEQLSS